MELVFIIIGIIIVWIIFNVISDILQNSNKYKKLKVKSDELNNREKKIDDDRRNFQKEKKSAEEELYKKHLENIENIKKRRQELEKIAKQKSMGFPWLAKIYANYFAIRDWKMEEYLKFKPHPTFTAAEAVRLIWEEKEKLLTENKILEYKMNYFVSLFPWLSDLNIHSDSWKIPVLKNNL